MEIDRKDGVKLDTRHFHQYHTGRIFKAIEEEWPDYPIIITRGCEDCPGSKKTSKHFKFKAFDFRTKHLPPEVDRQELLDRIMKRLGPDYYGYYRRIETDKGVTEWTHIQNNR